MYKSINCKVSVNQQFMQHTHSTMHVVKCTRSDFLTVFFLNEPGTSLAEFRPTLVRLGTPVTIHTRLRLLSSESLPSGGGVSDI